MINSRAVWGRILFDPTSVDLSWDELAQRLKSRGFGFVHLKPQDVLGFYAKELLGTGCFDREATLEQAPEVVKCSTLIQYIYANIGHYLPDMAFHQYQASRAITVKEAAAGDLVFSVGKQPIEGIGHVGIVADIDRELRGTVVQATSKVGYISEKPFQDFIQKRGFVGIRRPADHVSRSITLRIPPSLLAKVQSSEDVKSVILQ